MLAGRKKKAEVFYRLLKYLNNKADLVNIETAIEAQMANQIIKDKLIAFTFDDGFQECYTKLAPCLSRLNVNAAFFIIPEFVNGDISTQKSIREQRLSNSPKSPMTREQIRTLATSGFHIGGHTSSHLRLDRDDHEFLTDQIVKCKKKVEEIANTSCKYFAFPYGDFASVSNSALQLMTDNYEIVFSSDRKGIQNIPYNNVINRTHFEGDWPGLHMNYFLR